MPWLWGGLCGRLWDGSAELFLLEVEIKSPDYVFCKLIISPRLIRYFPCHCFLARTQLSKCFSILMRIICVKHEFFRIHTMMAYRGSRGIALLILNLGTGWRWMVNFKTCHFTPGKEPWYLLTRRLGGPQNQFWQFGERKNLLPLLAFEPWIMQPAAWLVYKLF